MNRHSVVPSSLVAEVVRLREVAKTSEFSRIRLPDFITVVENLELLSLAVHGVLVDL